MKNLFKRKTPRIVATPADLAGVERFETVVLVGEAVTCQLGAMPVSGPYVPQPSRKVSRGMAAMKVFAQLGISEGLAEALRPHRWLDVRLAYDRYFAHVLDHRGDVVLVAGAPVPNGTWLTEIVKSGSAITSVTEARLDPVSHPAFAADFSSRLSQIASRNPAAEIQVAIPDYFPTAHQSHRNLLSQLHDHPKLSNVDVGRAVIPGKLLIAPLLLILAALAYAAVGLRGAEARIEVQRKAYAAAVRGVEDEFKKGHALVERLEARKAFLVGQSERPNPVAELRRLLSAAASSGESILQYGSFALREEGGAFKLRLAVLPELTVGPVEQFTPFLTKLAASYGHPVRMPRYSDERFAPISTTIAFRSYELAGVVPPNQVNAGGGK